MLELEAQLGKRINKVFEEERTKALQELDELWKAKAASYDEELGVMQRSPFGEASFLHELDKKSGRLLASWKRGSEPIESIDEQLRDLANYAIGLIAYRRAVKRLNAVELKFAKASEPS